MEVQQPALVVVPDGVRRRLRRVAVPVLALAVVLSLTATAAMARSGGEERSGEPAAPRALVLTGSSLSYVAGRGVADALGWDAQVYTLPGGGISRSTFDPAGSITAQARRLLPATGGDPDVVLVQGGEADHAAAPATVQRATEHLLDYVLAHAGDAAEVVLVGPIPGATVPESLRQVNDVLQGVARSRGIAYVDAISHGWQAGDPALAHHLSQVLAGR